MSMCGLLSNARLPVGFLLALCMSCGPGTDARAASPEVRYARVGRDWYRVVGTSSDPAIGTVDVLEVAGPRSDWSALLSRTLVVGPGQARVTYTVGDDSLSIVSLPAAAGSGPPDHGLPAVAEIDVNGTTAHVGLDALQRFLAAPQDEPQLEHELAALGLAFGDPQRFLDAHARFHVVDGAIEPPPVLRGGPTGIGACTRPCIACAGSTMSVVGTWFAIAGACGATLSTAGVIAPACIAAVIGHEVVALALLSACGECAVCLDQAAEQQHRCCQCTGKPDCHCENRPPCPPE